MYKKPVKKYMNADTDLSPLPLIRAATESEAACRPLFQHKVAAGFPSPAAEHMEKGLDLNIYLVQHKEASFFFQVIGDSMSGVGILENDLVLVDRSVTPQHGHCVLAVIDGDYTLKRLHLARGEIELHAENPSYKPIRMNEETELQVWGVVTGVVRKLRA